MFSELFCDTIAGAPVQIEGFADGFSVPDKSVYIQRGNQGNKSNAVGRNDAEGFREPKNFNDAVQEHDGEAQKDCGPRLHVDFAPAPTPNGEGGNLYRQRQSGKN